VLSVNTVSKSITYSVGNYYSNGNYNQLFVANTASYNNSITFQGNYLIIGALA